MTDPAEPTFTPAKEAVLMRGYRLMRAWTTSKRASVEGIEFSPILARREGRRVRLLRRAMQACGDGTLGRGQNRRRFRQVAPSLTLPKRSTSAGPC